jgi:hypothetical protein
MDSTRVLRSTCETDQAKIQEFYSRKAVRFGWVQNTVSFDDENIETLEKTYESDAYNLHPQYREVTDFISNF